uniref:uncharacterized protein LOC120336302 n=1 Tax=Styela clava TaxID=7725 RepID=UPI00193AB44C|nr:uncharacterized protein LOC120336302 [Styela clava]
MCDADDKVLSDVIMRDNNIETILHLLDFKFRNSYQVLQIVLKLCYANYKDDKGKLNSYEPFPIFFKVFRDTSDKWFKLMSKEHETALVSCCQILELLATGNQETKIKFIEQNGIENIASTLERDKIPNECKMIFIHILSKIIGSSKQVHDEIADYCQGQLINRIEKGIHILDDSRSINSIDINELEERICALANHQVGGRITFGVAKSGNIVGMRLTQKDRDEFRLGFDKLITQNIKPMILLDRTKFTFASTSGMHEDLFVVNIDIIGMDLGIHSTLDGRYMTIHNQLGYITEMSMNELKDMAAYREENRYLDEIAMLKSTIQRLKTN